MNKELDALERKLEIRNRELAEAHSHIAALEEKLLKLKQYRRELKVLRQQKDALRKSPERRVGQILLAPYRLPQTIAKKVWQRFHRQESGRNRHGALTEYQNWFEQHRASAGDLKRMRGEARAFASQPVISIVTPVFDTPGSRLEEAVQSVLTQAYENWELLLIDDGSADPDLLRILPQLAGRDQRIVLTNLPEHGGISAASNRGLELARGEWVTFLDHDDVLEPDALFQVVKLLQAHPDADLIYSDEDKLGENGLEAPVFKPDWSPDLFLSNNYIGHLAAVRREIVQKVGGFRTQFDSAQDYDLLFRITEASERIHHIPRVLYHWRRSESSSASSVRQKPGQLEASRSAIEDHLKRSGHPARVSVDWRTHAFCVRHELPEAKRISVVIANQHGTESLERCLDALTTKTTYPNYDIVVVRGGDNCSDGPAGFPHRLFSLPGNDSTLKNFAATETDSSWILFLDDNVEVTDPDWLTIMAEHVQRPEVGAVGTKLLDADGTIAHAGIVIGVNGIAQPAFRGAPAEYSGANRQLQVTRNCSAVSSACMLTRREVFHEAGGFDESLSGALADVDLCLKIGRASYLVVYTPFAKLNWHEAQPEKVDPSGETILRQRWPEILERDPFYNPNLSRERADFSLKVTPE
jgi:GT2 family glycosyltransferase